MVTIQNLYGKVKKRIHEKIVAFFRKTSFYPLIYKSYWHYRFSNQNNQANHSNYYAVIPNSGAGIGHQMANWIAGYWFAKKFGLAFAHASFSNQKWDDFLGFGEGEHKIADLVAKGYKKVNLPLFDESNELEVSLQKKIIASYANQKVVFLAEQDQFYRDQFGVMNAIKEKFHNAPARKLDQLIYDDQAFNIAIHVRRGDIVIGQENQNPNLQMRWQSNNYFETVLRKVLENLKTTKPIAIYLFSQGEPNEFKEFQKFEHLHFCLDMNAQDSFLHMVRADLLISSKSSFSYKPTLLNKGIKVCPKDFWHGYPDTEDWILVDNNGHFELN